MNKDMFLARNLNPALRVDTSRTGALTRSDAFGVLGEPYTQQVWVMENTGDVGLQRARLLAREALLEPLVGPDLVLAVEVDRHRQQPGRQEPVSRR